MAKQAFRIFSPKGGVILLVLLAIIGGLFMFLRQRYPVINDITTDFKNPPAFFATLEESGIDPTQMQYPEAFIPLQKSAYPFLAPLAVAGSPEQIFAKALQVAESQMGWKIVAKDLDNHRFQALATTKLLKFTDDIVVTIEGIEEQSTVNMRSKSRLGKGDFGANQERILNFFDELSKSSDQTL